MKKLFKVTLFASVFTSFVFLLTSSVSASTFNPNNLMDDAVFQNSSTMNAAQINSFLNSFPSSCISSNRGFYTPDPTGWSSSVQTNHGYTFGGYVTAGQAIYDASQIYHLNPQVIMATMQKEQSVITGGAGCHYTNPSPGSACTYSGGGCVFIAMSYACPGGCAVDYSTTDGSGYNGIGNAFSLQLIAGTWFLRWSQERAYGLLSGYPGYDSGDDNIYYSGPMTAGVRQRSSSSAAISYDGTDTLNDGNTVTISNGATASLYFYTPFESGNISFDNIFQQYFGGIFAAPYYASFYSQSAYPQLNPGQSANVSFMYQNNGALAWYDNNSINSAPAGTYPIHLATNRALNRLSAFGSTWPNYSRPAVNFSAVYDSDGTTLAANQDVALPGQIVKFSFTMTAPNNLLAGTYPEYFIPVAEGTSNGGFNDPGTSMNVNVNPVPNISYVGQSAYPTIPAGTSVSSYLQISNSGNVPLYDDDSISTAPSGTFPVHLATSNPLNGTSNFGSTWPSSTRADTLFSAVYNSDGKTLASNQHIALPGQIVQFNFSFSATSGFSAGTYQQYLQPILEGTSNGYFSNLGISWTITVPSSPVIQITNNPTVSLTSNQPGSVTINIQNVGNTSTTSNLEVTTSNGSGYSTNTWDSTTNILNLGRSLSPGDTASVAISLLAPNLNASSTTPLIFGFNDNGANLSVVNSSIPTNITASSFSAQFIANTPSLALSVNQVGTAIFDYKNTGNQPWYDDSSISSATWRNALPTHLATANLLNRSSGFDHGWINAARPTGTFSAVFNSDGTTLASNQHVAQPGQIIQFSFPMSPQSWIPAGQYKEYFQPIIEGTSNGELNYIGSYINMYVDSPIYSDAYYNQSNYPVLSSNQQANVWIEYQNTGNQVWYDDTSISSAPAGSYPIHLATNRALNRSSAFGALWPSYTRAAVNFSAVYNPDGVTLAGNQHEVLPGQIVKFNFTMSSPNNLSSGVYPEYFIPVAEGSASGLLNDPGTVLNVTMH